MKSGIRTYLLANATLAAAVGSRVYSFPAPQNATKPYLTLSRISGVPMNLIGSSLEVDVETWQVDVMASTDLSAETVKRLVANRMNVADRVEMGTFTVYSCALTGVTDNSDLEMVGGQTADIRTTLEFAITRETAPTP